MPKIQKFKKGAASFYIVAFSTLILLVVATSFAAIIISEISRTSNNDLSQSAYDSALAGVEDAKLAVYNYQECKKNRDQNNCKEIIDAFQEQSCDMVSKVLGRGRGRGQVIEESSVGNNMQQEYTCVKVNDKTEDYKARVSSIKVIKPKFSEPASTDKIKKIKIRWYSIASEEQGLNYFDSSSVSFPTKTNFSRVKGAPAPPTISLGIVQTGPNFILSDFDLTQSGKTNRGMVYLVPTNNPNYAAKPQGDNYYGAYSQATRVNSVPANALPKSNDKTATNLPYAVYCPENSDTEFACSATVELPDPIGGSRNKDTFMVVVASPYNDPVDIALEFFCSDDSSCASGDDEESGGSRATLDGVQVKVDSTGRANDLYRRVTVRLENSDAYSLSVMGPLELLGTGKNDGKPLLEKNDSANPVLCEWNFPRNC